MSSAATSNVLNVVCFHVEPRATAKNYAIHSRRVHWNVKSRGEARVLLGSSLERTKGSLTQGAVTRELAGPGFAALTCGFAADVLLN